MKKILYEEADITNPNIGFIGDTDKDIGVCDLECHILDLSDKFSSIYEFENWVDEQLSRNPELAKWLDGDT